MQRALPHCDLKTTWGWGVGSHSGLPAMHTGPPAVRQRLAAERSVRSGAVGCAASLRFSSSIRMTVRGRRPSAMSDQVVPQGMRQDRPDRSRRARYDRSLSQRGYRRTAGGAEDHGPGYDPADALYSVGKVDETHSKPRHGRLSVPVQVRRCSRS